MKRIANHTARQYVQSQTPFQGSNLFAEVRFNSYVVYSYGYHPLYVYNRVTKKWYANCDSYSRTTSKHAGQAHPHALNMRYGNTAALEKLIYHDDDSQTHESRPAKERNSKPRNPERETIRVYKCNGDNYRAYVEFNRYLSAREHYLDTLPRYLQHKIALIKLSPPGAYIDGIGGRTEHNVFVLNTNREN